MNIAGLAFAGMIFFKTTFIPIKCIHEMNMFLTHAASAEQAKLNDHVSG